jgi:LmbE family N-acetylglucosaminyl deacetylase
MDECLMRTYYDAIYLSPHLDDAALSCGGQIYGRTAVGQSVLILTIMAGDPPDGPFSAFAASLHRRWGLAAAEVAAARRAEDVAACAELGADFAHWQTLDCVYRTDPESGEPLYPTWPAVITAVHPADHPLISQLAGQLAGLPPAGQIFAPLAVGGHADHRVVRAAAEACFGERLTYYEDYPYVAEGGALTAVIPPHDPAWRSQAVPLTPADLQAKMAAIAAYVSQFHSFFHDWADLEEKIGRFAASVGGERVWRKTAVQ